MKKRVSFIVVGMVLILCAGVFVYAANQVDSGIQNEVEKSINSLNENNDLEIKIDEITKVELDELPEQINFGKIEGDVGIQVHEVKLDTGQKYFMITASTPVHVQLEVQETVVEINEELLFSLNETNESTFLKFNNSLVESYNVTGSVGILGIETEIEVENFTLGDRVEIVIIVNEREIGFRNSFILKEDEILFDSDTISSNVLNFDSGDEIYLKVVMPEGVNLLNIETKLNISKKEKLI